MAETSAIEWTDATWNPVTGCTKVSPGCKFCYAERVTERWGRRKFTDIVLHPDRLELPLRWRAPRRIFVNSMSDLFHERVPFEFIDQAFQVMARADRHIFQVLTKRADRMLQWFRERGGASLPAHIWMDVSVELASYLWRIDRLREVNAPVRFVSAEPLRAGRFPETSSLRSWLAPLNVLPWSVTLDALKPSGEPLEPSPVTGEATETTAEAAVSARAAWRA